MEWEAEWVLLGSITGTIVGMFGVVFVTCSIECEGGFLPTVLSSYEWALIILPICWWFSRISWREGRPWGAVVGGLVGGIVASVAAFLLMLFSSI